MKRRTLRTLALALVVLVALLAFHTEEDEHGDAALAAGPSATHSATSPFASDDNWPQFRGPGGRGISEDSEVPTTWTESENILWKTAIEGKGHSSPVVWGDRIFLTTGIAGDVIPGAGAPTHYIAGQVFKHPQSEGSDRSHTLKVLAIDRGSGEILWSQVAYEGRVYDNVHQAASYASPTMATDGEMVYAYFGSQRLYAYDFDGEPVWSAGLGKIGSFGVGIGTSPVLFEGLVIVLVDNENGDDSFIVAFDKKTGEEVWRTPRRVEASWATPLIIEDRSGRQQMLTNGNQFLTSYDPATGEELWRLDGLASNAIHAPLYDGERVIFTTGYPRKVIRAIDLGDGPDGNGAPEVIWEYNKGAAYVSSNLLYDGLLFVTNDKGILTCLDAATGEVIYEGGRIPVPTNFLMSSLLGVNGRIMVSTMEGDTFFIAAGREFEIVSSAELDEPIAAMPAIVDGKIYLRGAGHLYAIGTPTP